MYGNLNPYQNFIQQTTPQFNQFTQPQQRTIQPMQDIIQVNGLDGAKAYQMGANSRVILMDMQEPVVYIKMSDGANFSTLNAYTLTPIEQATQNAMPTDFETRLKRLEDIINEQSTIANKPKSTNAKSKSSTKSATDGTAV